MKFAADHPWSDPVAETITLLCHMTDPWPREVIGEQACLILRQRVQYSHPTFRRLLGIGIVHELGQRLLQQEDRMVSEVAGRSKATPCLN